MKKTITKGEMTMTTIRADFMGGGIAEFFAGGPGMHGLLWLAAFIGAIVGGAFGALVTRSGLCKSSSTDASAGQASYHGS